MTIAVLDTGVDLAHPDLVDNLVPGIDLLSYRGSRYGMVIVGVDPDPSRNPELVTWARDGATSSCSPAIVCHTRA